jgi:predicted HAD superfamily hydrolase
VSSRTARATQRNPVSKKKKKKKKKIRLLVDIVRYAKYAKKKQIVSHILCKHRILVPLFGRAWPPGSKANHKY